MTDPVDGKVSAVPDISHRLDCTQTIRSRHLVNIPKVQILLIRQIAKRRRIHLLLMHLPLQPTRPIQPLQPISLLILPRQQKPQHEHNRNLQQMRHNHAPDAQDIRRRLLRPVEERPGDVAHAVAQEETRAVDHLLGVAGRVGGLERQQQHEGRVDRRRQVVADETAGAVVLRDVAEAERAGDVGQEEGDEEETSVVGGEESVQVDA